MGHRHVGSTLAALIVLLCSQNALGQAPESGASAPPAGSGAGGDESASGTSRTHDLRFLPGVRLSQSYSSNVLRRPSGQEEDGFITEVTPYLRASVDRARLQGRMDLSVRNFYRSETRDGFDSTDMLRYALGASGHYMAPGNRFGMLGSASIRDVSLSPFGLNAEDPSLVPANRRRFTRFGITPYFTGRLGTLADYRAEYSAETSRIGGASGAAARLDQRISGLLSSGSQFQRWGWAVNGSRQHRDFQGDFSLGRTEAAGRLYYIVSPELRIGASANYAKIDRLTGSDGSDGGWGPGLEVDWSPNRRTSLHASWANQYFGSTGQLNLTHRARHWTFGLHYLRSVLTSSDASVLFFNPAAIFAGGSVGGFNPIYQALLDQALLDSGDVILDAGLITDAAVFTRRATASLGYTIPRGSVLLTVYQSTRERAVENLMADTALGAFTGDIEQRGGSLGIRVNLGQRSSLRLLARHQESDSSTAGLKSRLDSVQASYHAQLGPATSAGVGLRRTVQKSSGNAYNYEDNTLFGTLDLRF